MAVLDKVKRAWNAFRYSEETSGKSYTSVGPGSSYMPQRVRPMIYSDRSIISSIYTRLSIDVAGVPMRHIKLDDQGRYGSDVKSELNNCLKLDPNLDQGPRALRQDIALTMFNKGVLAVVPVDTLQSSDEDEQMEIYSLRVGEIVEWFPAHVRISLYNERKGIRQEVLLEKRQVAVIENPLYAVMNESNSTLQRLTRKLQLLDVVDEQSSSGKLDIIIQLPYVIKSEARRLQAEKRREDIEFQLKGGQYGIAYTDGTEKITQLNRPAENNLLKQVEYLTGMLYDELGLTKEVMSGTADEKTMINYFNRTIEPILDAITESMQKTFVGPFGTKRGERIRYFRDPFKLVPLSEIATIADVFARNEILSSNEIRSFMGIQPSANPKADELVNSNMPQPEAGPAAKAGPTFDEVDAMMDEVFNGLTEDIDTLVKGDD